MPDNHTETALESSSDHTQEVRFAVVMYGGVSLAVYINGVSQELLRMVRSTAQTTTNGAGVKESSAPITADKLTGSERVYRKVSYLLFQTETSPTDLDDLLK